MVYDMFRGLEELSGEFVSGACANDMQRGSPEHLIVLRSEITLVEYDDAVTGL